MLSATVPGEADDIQNNGNRRAQKDAGGGGQQCGSGRRIRIPATQVPDHAGTTTAAGRVAGGAGCRRSRNGVDGAVLAARVGKAGGALAAAAAEPAGSGESSWGIALGASPIEQGSTGAEE